MKTRSFVRRPSIAGLRGCLHGGALFALSCPAALHAQDRPPAEPPAELGTTVIQASPFDHTVDELIQPVEVLSGEALERRRRGTIGDVLAEQPGIANASFGPGVGRPVIRGQGGPRVRILENGIGVGDASSISADHAVTIDPLGAEQVEVIKGPATLIYGGAASAGVVNVVDDRLPDVVTPGLSAKGDLSYGDNGDETNGALRARYGAGRWQFGANYARREAEDFEIPGQAVRDTEYQEEEHGQEEAASGILENSSVDTESYGASAAWVVDRGMLGVAIGRYETDYGVPGREHQQDGATGQQGHDDHGGVRIDMEQTRVDLRGQLHDPLPGFARAETRVGIADYSHREIEASGEVGTVFDVREQEGRVELEHRPLGRWAGIVGAQLTHRDFEAIGEEAFVPPVESSGLGLFLVEGHEYGAHHVELGARVDTLRHQAEGGFNPDRRFNTLSLSAGVNFELAEHLHLRVNLQRAQRAPAAEELYAFGPHIATAAFERGDSGLDPETANNLDLGLARDGGRWEWQLGAYYNRLGDYVFLDEVDSGLGAGGSGTPAADGVADRVDEEGSFDPEGELLLLDMAQQDAEIYGAEASMRFKLVDSGPLRLALRGFGDIVRGELADSGENLPRMTPARLGLSLEGSWRAVSASLGYTRAMRQRRTAPLETETPGYDLLSADLSYTIALPDSELRLYARGRNLLDEEQRLATSFLKDVAPQPGRSLFVGLRFDFGPTG